MADQCVVAVYDKLSEAKSAAILLEQAEYPAEQISLVTKNVAEEVPQDQVLQYGDDSEVPAARSAAIGGVLGLLLGTPLLWLPGIGQVLIAGPHC